MFPAMMCVHKIDWCLVSLCLACWLVEFGFGLGWLKTLLHDWRLYLRLPLPRNVADLLHGLKVFLPGWCHAPGLAPSKKRLDFDDDGQFSFDEMDLNSLLMIADALQIAVSAST